MIGWCLFLEAVVAIDLGLYLSLSFGGRKFDETSGLQLVEKKKFEKKKGGFDFFLFFF